MPSGAQAGREMERRSRRGGKEAAVVSSSDDEMSKRAGLRGTPPHMSKVRSCGLWRSRRFSARLRWSVVGSSGRRTLGVWRKK